MSSVAPSNMRESTETALCDKAAGGDLASLLVRWGHVLGWVTAIAGYTWIALFPAVTITTGEAKTRGTYFEENALMVTLMTSTIGVHEVRRASELHWRGQRALREKGQEGYDQWLCDELEAISPWLRCHRHEAGPHESVDMHGRGERNVWAVLETGHRRGDGQEALLITAYRDTIVHDPSSHAAESGDSVSGVALAVTLLAHLASNAPWLAKNIILLITPGGSQVDRRWAHLPQLKHWADSYHAGTLCSPVMPFAGNIRAALVVDMPGGAGLLTGVRVLSSGARGRLPNMDLVHLTTVFLSTTVSTVEPTLDWCAWKHSSTGASGPSGSCQVSDEGCNVEARSNTTSLGAAGDGDISEGVCTDPLSSTMRRVVGSIFAPEAAQTPNQHTGLLTHLLQPLAPPQLPPPPITRNIHGRRHHSAPQAWPYVRRLWAMLGFASSLASGASGGHAYFLRNGIDSVTIQPVRTPRAVAVDDSEASSSGARQPEERAVHELLQALEKTVRSLNNLESPLYHGFFLYLMPSPEHFVSLSEYLYSAILLLLPMLPRIIALAWEAGTEAIPHGLVALTVAAAAGWFCFTGLRSIADLHALWHSFKYAAVVTKTFSPHDEAHVALAWYFTCLFLGIITLHLVTSWIPNLTHVTRRALGWRDSERKGSERRGEKIQELPRPRRWKASAVVALGAVMYSQLALAFLNYSMSLLTSVPILLTLLLLPTPSIIGRTSASAAECGSGAVMSTDAAKPGPPSSRRTRVVRLIRRIRITMGVVVASFVSGPGAFALAWATGRWSELWSSNFRRYLVSYDLLGDLQAPWLCLVMLPVSVLLGYALVVWLAAREAT